MVVQNTFLKNAGTIAVRNISGETPTHMFFAGSDNTFVGDETAVVNDYVHKIVTWTQTGIDSKFSLELSTSDAIGSYILAYGLVSHADVASGSPFTGLPSGIGNKTDTLSVEVEGEILFRRPL